MKRLPLILNCVVGMLSMASSSAWAASWACENKNLEVQCSAKKCEASESFTPIQLQVDDKGSLSLCAYSGCWTGKGKVFKSGPHVMVSVPKAKRSQAPHETASIVLAIHAQENTAVVHGLGFAMPLVCE